VSMRATKEMFIAPRDWRYPSMTFPERS
jgi:hypothetical protein